MTLDPCLRVVFLGSGSSGNAAAVTDGETTILIDCGFSAREVARRMAAASLDPGSVSAILVTHEHSDHVRGIDVFARRHASSCTVFATRGTRYGASLEGAAFEVRSIRGGEPLRVGGLDILPFKTSHDAAEPVGYRIEGCGFAVGVVTDTGVLTAEAAEALAGVDVLGIESNHDPRMLEVGPYPAFLKHRIRSTAGHLSNLDAADAVERLASDRLRSIFALHRSRTNNTERIAATTLRNRVARLGLHVPVTIASQADTCDSAPPQGTLFDSGAP